MRSWMNDTVIERNLAIAGGVPAERTFRPKDAPVKRGESSHTGD